MKKLILFSLSVLLFQHIALSQNRLAVLGSSTAAGLAATPVDSSWVNRLNRYYKAQPGALDTIFNLGVSASTVYNGMPTSYTAPPGRPAPDSTKNVSKAITLLSRPAVPARGVVLVNFPTNGYDVFSIAEIIQSLRIIYDSVTANGYRCFITTSQPRSDGNFASSAVKAKLAAINNEIISQFGIAQTINFWDGMYNPADTTILPAYSAGDNVHFNNAGHRELFNRVAAKNIFALSQQPVAGDYRSNVNPTGLWSNPASWQTWNGTSWVTATSAPDSNSGRINIVAGDSIRVYSATAMDQVTVDSGAILGIFNVDSTITYTLANGPGDDITVYGSLYVSAGDVLSGTGSIYNAPGGLLILRNQGNLRVNTLNEGLVRVSGTGNIQLTTLTNNGTLELVDFTLNLNNATLINNDSLVIRFNSNAYIASSTGAGILVNATTGVIHNLSAAGITTISPSIAFSNAGTLKGIGQFIVQNFSANTGTISPGNSPGILTVNPGVFNGRSPVLNMEISTTGAVAGTSYDQLQLSTVGSATTNLSGTTLRLTNTGNDPVGTVYTLLATAGTMITGPFASVSLPPNFSAPVFNGSSVTVQKIAVNPLPLTLLSFTGKSTDVGTMLAWETALETPGDHFELQRSGSPSGFETIKSIPAKGHAATYSYTDHSINASQLAYYRLKISTANGGSSYSQVLAVQRSGAAGGQIRIYPIPAGDKVTITTDRERRPGQTAVVMDAAGQKVLQFEWKQQNELFIAHWPAGMYWLYIPDAPAQPLLKQ